MRIWQVNPMARPHMAAQVIAQFAAQNHHDKRLCIVTSGLAWAGVDAELYFRCLGGPRPDKIVKGPNGKGPALNAAIDALPGEFLVVRDDDDIYTPHSLTEFAERLPVNDFVAQRRHWTQLSDGRLILFSRHNHSKAADTHLIWGGNLGFYTLTDTPFSDDPVAQCQHFVRDMMAKGAKGWLKSPRGACISRDQSDHLWKASDTMVRHVFGDGEEFSAEDLKALVDSADIGSGEFVVAPSIIEAHHAELDRLACAR